MSNFFPLYFKPSLSRIKPGFLDPSNQNENLVSGSKMELPLWMASYLANKEFVACELPKPYQETSRNILLADSSVVDLFKQVIVW